MPGLDRYPSMTGWNVVVTPVIRPYDRCHTTRTVSDFSTRTVRHQNAERERFSSMCGSIWYSALVRPRYGGENDETKKNRVQGS